MSSPPAPAVVSPPLPIRPGSVTAASVLMFVLAGLAGLGGLTLWVTGLVNVPIKYFFTNTHFEDGLWLLVLGAGALVSAILALGGNDRGRLIGFAILGGGAIVGWLALLSELLSLPFADMYDPVAGSLVDAALYLAIAAFGTIPVLLLVGRKAARWFHDRRQSLSVMDVPIASGRPSALRLAIRLMILAALLKVVHSIALTMDTLLADASYVEPAEDLIGDIPHQWLPVVLLTVAILGLPRGTDLARALAFGWATFYCYRGISYMMHFVLHWSFPTNPNGLVLVTIATIPTAAAAAGAALVLLAKPQVSRWFDNP